MDKDLRKLNLICLQHLLKPVVEFCIRRGLAFQDLSELARKLFVDGAAKQIKESGSEPNVSRISVLTGLRRREIDRLIKGESSFPERATILTRVVGRWLSDPQFLDSTGQPRSLKFKDADDQFRALVEKVTKDVGPATVLAELERVGVVKIGEQSVRLVEEAYIPKEDPTSSFEILSSDVTDMVFAVEENVFCPGEVPNLHATTEYDNISEEKLPLLRRWLIREGMDLHRRAREIFSTMDLDLNSKLLGKGGYRVVIGTFSRIIKSDDKKDVPSKVRKK